MELFVFNPEHDYALADGNPHFVALQTAVQFSYDCAPFMSFLSTSQHSIFDSYVYENGSLTKNFNLNCPKDELEKITPWGWDAAIRTQLLTSGVSETLLPTSQQIANIRDLAHRKNAIIAQKFISDKSSFSNFFPNCSTELNNIEDVESFVKINKNVLFKSPYSGNGRGHLYAHYECSETLLRQISGVISRQGSIIAEKLLSVVQDFAMEFEISDKKSSFLGYSLFKTKRYAYDLNILMSDGDILKYLSKYLNVEVFEDVKSRVIEFLDIYVASNYQGVVGVDMFLYNENDTIKLQPFSEMNIRMTMGYAAHQIFDKYCHPNSFGIFKIVRYKENDELKRFVDENLLKNPLKMRDGMWYSGFISLTPLNDTTKYSVCVKLSEEVCNIDC